MFLLYNSTVQKKAWPSLTGSSRTNHNQIFIWVKYNELTTSSLEIIVSKGNHPQMALIQVSEIL